MCQQHNSVRKGLAIENAFVIDDSMMLSPIWDTRPVDGAVVNFFPPQPQASQIESNYEAVPLPGPYDHNIVGAILKSTKGVITVDNAADADGIVNALQNATLLVLADSNNKQLAEMQLEEVMNLDEIEIDHTVLADGATDEYRISLPPGDVQKLRNPFTVANQQTFKARVQFENADGIPADTLRLALTFVRAIPKG